MPENMTTVLDPLKIFSKKLFEFPVICGASYKKKQKQPLFLQLGMIFESPWRGTTFLGGGAVLFHGPLAPTQNSNRT